MIGSSNTAELEKLLGLPAVRRMSGRAVTGGVKLKFPFIMTNIFSAAAALAGVAVFAAILASTKGWLPFRSKAHIWAAPSSHPGHLHPNGPGGRTAGGSAGYTTTSRLKWPANPSIAIRPATPR